MCGRYTLTLSLDDLWDAFELLGDPLEMTSSFPQTKSQLSGRYNIAPSQRAPIVAARAPGRVRLFQWGLVPHWAKERSIGHKLINARKETLRGKPAFREALRLRRCIVLADGFYEWKSEGKKMGAKRTPHFATTPKGETKRTPMSFAGLWESHKLDGDTLRTFTIVTQEATGEMASVHHRMPILLSERERRTWLTNDASEPEIDRLLLEHVPPELAVRPVSAHVNSPKNDDAQCIASV